VVAGTVILVPLPDGDGEFEVGWHFHPDSWEKGLVTEAADAALSWAWAHGLARWTPWCGRTIRGHWPVSQARHGGARTYVEVLSPDPPRGLAFWADLG
jgi:hypothetical protein